ncbi:MAG: 4-hydroxythreonine-4-phosphate dehydrogenase PdxA [Candidatus Omnitrophica bacterium]|nr:4-hydroxythreonine-4-phosphate dehydrogenase PdxA [Candidatus Omnitrophota bacterium]
MARRKQVIGITMGDAAGIGPEICLKAVNHPAVKKVCHPVIIGDASILKHLAPRWNLKVLSLTESFSPRKIAGPAVIDLKLVSPDQIKPGISQACCGQAAFLYIKTAISLTSEGKLAAVVTAPISKKSLHLAGINYPGHTEIFTKLTGAKKTCMMLASKTITCSLVTTHTNLASVPGLLSTRRILEVIELSAEALSRLKKRKPRLAICALNPHAGEEGLFGAEEERFIRPAVRIAQEKGIVIEGPWPADTAFIPERRKIIDGYICLYHDQGLIPFKMLAFDTGVNITLGLPMVRTSVDHGTAFDIAWKGIAKAESLVTAIHYAVLLVESRTNQT